MKSVCPLCGKYTETVPLWSSTSCVRCCQNCLDDLLPVEICRTIGHDYEEMFAYNIRNERFDIVAKDVDRKCRRCGHQDHVILIWTKKGWRS